MPWATTPRFQPGWPVCCMSLHVSLSCLSLHDHYQIKAKKCQKKKIHSLITTSYGLTGYHNFLCVAFMFTKPSSDTHTHPHTVSHECGVNVGHSNSLSDSLLPALSGSLCVISASAGDYEPRWFIRTSGANLSLDYWVELMGEFLCSSTDGCNFPAVSS